MFAETFHISTLSQTIIHWHWGENSRRQELQLSLEMLSGISSEIFPGSAISGLLLSLPHMTVKWWCYLDIKIKSAINRFLEMHRVNNKPHLFLIPILFVILTPELPSLNPLSPVSCICQQALFTMISAGLWLAAGTQGWPLIGQCRHRKWGCTLHLGRWCSAWLSLISDVATN